MWHLLFPRPPLPHHSWRLFIFCCNNVVSCCYAATSKIFFPLLFRRFKVPSFFSFFFLLLVFILRPSVWLWRINRFRSVSWIWLQGLCSPYLSSLHSTQNTVASWWWKMRVTLLFFVFPPPDSSLSLFSPFHIQPFFEREKVEQCGSCGWNSRVSF